MSEEGEEAEEDTSPSLHRGHRKSLIKNTACSVRRARQSTTSDVVIDGDLSNNFVIYNWTGCTRSSKATGEIGSPSATITIVEKVPRIYRYYSVHYSSFYTADEL